MRIFFLFVSCLILFANAGAAWAETAPASPPAVAVAARAGEHADFDRIVFDWPRTVEYHVSRAGDRVTVQFDANATTRFGSDFSYLTRARGFSSSSDGGHLTVSFTVDPQTKLKDFTSDKSVVIDVQKSSAARETRVAAKTVKPAEKPPAASAPAAESAAATAPPTPLPEAPSPAEATPDLVLSAPPTDETKPVAAPPIAVTSAQPSATARSSAPTLDIGDAPLLVASFDPHTALRTVIFERAGYGYIIFDRKISLSLDALTAGQEAPRVKLEPLDLPKNSGYRFAVPDNADMRASRDGTAWHIFMAKQQSDIPVSTTLLAQPDFALGSRYLLPLPDAPDPIRFTDPVVGDDLILIPLSQPEAFSVARSMADFDIIPAAQGLVLKPLTDKVIVRPVSDGLEITAEGGLKLSSAIDTGASQQSTQKAKAAAAGKSMFDFAGWRGKPDETFTQTRQRLQQTIVDVPEAERNRARLELARFYFAHGNGEEAVGLLNYLAKQVPDLTAHADFLALLGASKVISYRPDEGLKDFDTPLLAHQPEIELWQAVAEAELRNWASAEEKFSLTEGMLDGYPEPFYSRFGILAVESALAADKDHEAADWLDHLENGPHRLAINPAISYLRGVLHAKAGRAAAAAEAWKETDTSNDRLYKIRAELALIDLGVSNGSLSPAQAADRLESLRFGWRGDDLEVDILHRLGQFYIQAKNVKNGLNALARAVQLYPTSPLTPEIRQEMSKTFHDIFLGDLGKNLSALDALTLYQQYRDLMPTGADGIAVTRNLAERLVAIDLLDQAADLLQELVKNKLQGEDKARTGARLAAIRLLDRKPDAALAALDMSKEDNLPQDVQNERLLLRAKALSGLHRDDEALSLLQDDTQQAAKLLRADITMHAQRWDDASKALLDLIGPPPKPGETLSPEKAQWIVNCAIAMALANNQDGIDKLAIDFGAAMAGTPQNDSFRILTQPEKTGQLRDMAGVQSRISDVDLFQGFLDNYRKTEEKPAAPAAAQGK